MTLESAIDELLTYNELKTWCDNYISKQQIEEIALAIMENN